MFEIKPNIYTQNEKLISVWTVKKIFLSYCRMCKFYVRQGIIVDKNYEITSFDPYKRLKKYISFNTQKK